jgi:hypothetical protein
MYSILSRPRATFGQREDHGAPLITETTTSLPEQIRASFSRQMEEISAAEEAILHRPARHFLDMMSHNRAITASIEDQLIGFVAFTPLADNISEIGSAYVNANYRNQGLYFQMRQALHRQANRVGTRLLATVKPSCPDNPGEIITDVKFGLWPVPFETLQGISPEAYRECCCCSSMVEGICEYQNRRCFLVLQEASPEDSAKLLALPAWQDTENIPASVRARVETMLGSGQADRSNLITNNPQR